MYILYVAYFNFNVGMCITNTASLSVLKLEHGSVVHLHLAQLNTHGCHLKVFSVTCFSICLNTVFQKKDGSNNQLVRCTGFHDGC